MSNDFSFLKDNIDFIILNALYKGDKYCYELSKEILERTENRYEIKKSTLYAYLKRLEEQNFIRSYWGEQSNGGRRRYYSITDTGKLVCEKTLAEWNTRRELLDNLLISDDDTTTAPPTSNDDIASEAIDLQSVTNLNNSRQRRSKPQIDEDTVTNLNRMQEEVDRVLNNLQSQPAPQDNQNIAATTSQVAPSQASAEPEPVASEPTPQQTSPAEEQIFAPVDSRAEIFEVQQDNAEVFIRQFERNVQNMSEDEQIRPESQGRDDYRETFHSLLSEQLEEMQRLDEQPEFEYNFVNDRPLALEEVANQLAKEGLRMRIYNSTTAAFKPKELFPFKKVLALTAWGATVGVIALLTILLFATLGAGTYITFIVSMAVILLIPIVLTVIAAVDPVRKDKPHINFARLLTVSIISSVVVILLSFGINIGFNLLLFSDIGTVATQIGIPSVISLLFPFGSLILKLFFEKYAS